MTAAKKTTKRAKRKPTTNADRVEQAKGRTKGMFLTLLRKATPAEMEGVDISKVWIEVADENEGLRDDLLVKDYVEENNLIGVFYPVRFGRGQMEDGRRFVQRGEQKVIKTTVG